MLSLQLQVEEEYRRRLAVRAEENKQKLAEWQKDFVSFTKNLKVPPKDGGEPIQVTQSPILKSLEEHRTGRDYVLKPRQVFMTTWELARDIWFFITRPGVNVVILCQSSADNGAVKEISARLVTMFESLREAWPEAPFAKATDTRWERTDGTKSTLKIVGAGATEKSANKKGRSGTIHRLHVTEVAFFEYAHETLTAVLACVPPDLKTTEIVFESTPRGAAGAFYDGYMGARAGTSGYHAHFFRWFDQPEYRTPLAPGEKIEPRTEREKQLFVKHGVSLEQLKWYRQKVADPLLGQAKVDQEFPSDEETCWLFDGRTFFDKEALLKLLNDAQPPIDYQFHRSMQIWYKPDPKQQYIVAIDPAGGTSSPDAAPKDRGDPVAVVVLEKETGRHMASLHGWYPPDVAAAMAATIGWAYNQATIVLERSSSWAAMFYVLSMWERPTKDGKGYPRIYYHHDRKVGFPMSPTSRVEVLDNLEAAIRTGKFQTFDVDFAKEAQLFIVVDNKPGAAQGAHDDRVMAMAIGWHLLQIPAGLAHTEFAPSPSIAYANVPVSFEGIHAGIENVVQQQLQKWAGGDNTQSSFSGYSIHNHNDMEGF